MKKYLSAFVCGFGAGVLQVVPVAKSFSCCLIIPAAAFLALVLEQRANPSEDNIPFKKALIIGALTGLYAALFGSFFDIFVTLITKTNDILASFPELQKMVNGFPITDEMKNEVISLLTQVREDILQKGFSLLYAVSVIVNNLIINTIFGIIGGIIGVQIINYRRKNYPEE